MSEADVEIHREHRLTAVIADLLEMATKYDELPLELAAVALTDELEKHFSTRTVTYGLSAIIMRLRREGQVL